MKPPAPGLMCLNLQADILQPGARFMPRAENVLANAHACLGWARRHELTVIHVFSSTSSRQAPTPIPGFQARPSEIIAFKRSLSIFDGDDVVRAITQCGNLFVLGFAGFEDCLAAAFDAPRHGARLAFVIDAISSPAFTRHAPEVVDAIVGDMLGALAGKITTSELLAREAHAFVHGAPAPFRQIRGTS